MGTFISSNTIWHNLPSARFFSKNHSTLISSQCSLTYIVLLLVRLCIILQYNSTVSNILFLLYYLFRFCPVFIKHLSFCELTSSVILLIRTGFFSAIYLLFRTHFPNYFSLLFTVTHFLYVLNFFSATFPLFSLQCLFYTSSFYFSKFLFWFLVNV